MNTLLATVLAASILGQTAIAPPSTPEELAAVYLATAQREGLRETGRFYDPSTLADIKSAFLPLLEREASNGQAIVRHAMFGTATPLDAIRGLQPVDFFRGVANFFQVQMEDSSLPLPDSAIVGSVYEGDDVAHVLVRFEPLFNRTNLDVVSMRRNGQTWALFPGEELAAFTELARQQTSASDVQN